MGVLTSARAKPTPPIARARAPGRFDRLDLVGLGLTCALFLWTVVSAVVVGGNPFPMLLLLGGCAAVLLLSRRAARETPLVVPGLVVVVGLLLFVMDPLGIAGSGAGSGPFGYANAKAAFYVMAAAAAMMVAAREGSRRVRIGALIAAVGFALIAPASAARTASIVAVGLPIAGIVAAWGRFRWAFVTLCAVVTLTASLGTTALAVTGDAATLGRTLDPRRVRLWEEAADLMVSRPWFGVGPGRFADTSPTAGSDEDARWAHHDFLHVGAESGIPGFLLLLLLFLWALARIGTGSAATSTAIPAAFAVAALATMASFDHVLNYALIPLVGAALVGTGASLQGHRRWQPAASARTFVKVIALPWGLVRQRRPGDVVILLYHRVGVGDREIDAPVDAFDEQMAMLAESGEVRTLEDALSDDRGGVVVSFDDGYRDFHEQALPVLVRHRVPATLYLATGLIDGGPGSLTWSQLDEAATTGLITVGGHTHGHTDLSRATAEVAEAEMRSCKELIEDRLGVPCRHFAYPWAVGSPAADRVARKLFASAALDAWQTNRRGRIDPYRLGRVPVLRGDGQRFFRWKVRGMLDGEALAYRLLRRGPWRRS